MQAVKPHGVISTVLMAPLAAVAAVGALLESASSTSFSWLSGHSLPWVCWRCSRHVARRSDLADPITRAAMCRAGRRGTHRASGSTTVLPAVTPEGDTGSDHGQIGQQLAFPALGDCVQLVVASAQKRCARKLCARLQSESRPCRRAPGQGPLAAAKRAARASPVPGYGSTRAKQRSTLAAPSCCARRRTKEDGRSPASDRPGTAPTVLRRRSGCQPRLRSARCRRPTSAAAWS